ncbi:ATP-binding protein [Roseibium marinum]|nr:HAMP domain-containing histidine kinase [Roseibium marinum]
MLSGAAALFVLPLHLALAGPPHVAEILVLAWMLSQWPLALYLSQSGKLNRAIGVSSSLFACTVAAICILTGGNASFAAIWLLIPLVEAAFSTSRKTPVLVATLCAVLLAAITFLPLPQLQFQPLQGPALFVTTLAALIYAGMLAYRLSVDRKRARNAMLASESRRQLMSQSVSEVFCELDPGGRIRVLGGPVKRIFGGLPVAGGEDWLFQRLHVADRPLYLTRLSDVRHSGAPAVFDVRVRVGASVPGETGQAEYRQLQLHIKAQGHEGGQTLSAADRQLLLLIRQTDDRLLSDEAEAIASPQESRTAGISRKLLETAGMDARKVFADIIAQAVALQTVGGVGPGSAAHAAAGRLRAAGEAGLEELDAVLDFRPGLSAVPEPDYGTIDIFACLAQCRKLVTPIADRRGVEIETEEADDLPPAVADGKCLRQALCFILSDMVETSESGAVVTVSGQTDRGDLEIVLSVKNRHSSLSWSSDASRPVLDFARELLERTGGSVSVQTMLGHGESVAVRLPVRPVPARRAGPIHADPAGGPVAKSA